MMKKYIVADMDSWQYFCDHHFEYSSIGLGIDVSKITRFDEISNITDKQSIFNAMAFLESGGIANPDENRMVGHYWLRNPSIAPTPALRDTITDVWTSIDRFVHAIHCGDICGQDGKFKNCLCIGIGGSALGPQLAHFALAQDEKLNMYFIDNTDPDGIDQYLKLLDKELGRTLVIVTSKSGGTPETRNGMLEVANAYEKHDLTFARHAVAITCEGSKLDQQAIKEGWIKRFPMWDWVGGRTSISSVVGLLPMALAGIDYKSFLNGMKDIDSVTRLHENNNPALLLSMAWYAATNGIGEKSMVILPYKDRLALFSKFLQQLIMESLGKKQDIDGNIVHQGITVYGNKGSTDQHAYVQQLRDGLNNFFVTFIEVLKDRKAESIQIENNITTGDYLEGFLLGTRQALAESGRESITISIAAIDAYHLGVLIGLYERAVSFYATMIHVNAYHQPGVEAGKKAANAILALQSSIFNLLQQHANHAMTVDEIATQLQNSDRETIFKLLKHLAENQRIKRQKNADIRKTAYLLS